jgi:hypothetical protein
MRWANERAGIEAVGLATADAFRNQSIQGLFAVNGNAPQCLHTWKGIARYLDCGVRTVQRWEAQLPLPVRRADGKNRSHVVAMPSAIDEWLKNTFSALRVNGPRPTAGDPLERKISRHIRRDPEISELVLRAKAIRRNIMELQRALSVAEAEPEAAINRLACSGARRLQADIGSIARINSDHSTGIAAQQH